MPGRNNPLYFGPAEPEKGEELNGKLNPLPETRTDGSVEERHRIDREMDGVTQTKVWSMKFHKFREILNIFKKKEGG
jgi:hypothetical protein